MQTIYDHIKTELRKTLDERLEISEYTGSLSRLCIDTIESLTVRVEDLSEYAKQHVQDPDTAVIYPGIMRLVSIRLYDGNINIGTTNACARICRTVLGPAAEKIRVLQAHYNGEYVSFDLADPHSIDNTIKLASSTIQQMLPVVEVAIYVDARRRQKRPV